MSHDSEADQAAAVSGARSKRRKNFSTKTGMHDKVFAEISLFEPAFKRQWCEGFAA